MSGRLIVCATPIGNLGDISPRLASTLADVDVIFAEDTRRTGNLLNHLGIRKPLRSFHTGNEQDQAREMTERLEAGQSVALVTDAGTPAISDPGLTAVAAARQAGAEVSIIPGPSAVTAALAVSGLPSDRFVFEGFLPRKSKDRRDRLSALAMELRTTVLFVAPHHLRQDLDDLRSVIGSRTICIAREMTKAYEEVWWGDLDGAIIEWQQRAPQGEFTIVVAGSEAPLPDLEAATDWAMSRIAAGEALATAVKEVATIAGVSRHELYESVLERRKT